jgi:hypothetical protein
VRYNIFIQDIGEDDIVTGFLPVSSPDPKIVLHSTSTYSVGVGDPALYAFRFQDGHIETDTRKKLSPVLEASIGDLFEYPITRLEVLQFIGKDNAIPWAIEGSFEYLNKASPRIARKWREQVMAEIISRRRDE